METLWERMSDIYMCVCFFLILQLSSQKLSAEHKNRPGANVFFFSSSCPGVYGSALGAHVRVDGGGLGAGEYSV